MCTLFVDIITQLVAWYHDNTVIKMIKMIKFNKFDVNIVCALLFLLSLCLLRIVW